MNKCLFGHDMSYPEEKSREIKDAIKKSDEAEGVESIFTPEELWDAVRSIKPNERIVVVSVDSFCPVCEKSYPLSECHSDTANTLGSKKLS